MSDDQRWPSAEELDPEIRLLIEKGITEYARPSVRSPVLEQVGKSLFSYTDTETLGKLLRELFNTAIAELSTSDRQNAARELLLSRGLLAARRSRASGVYRNPKQPKWRLSPETFRTGKKYESAIREELCSILRRLYFAGPRGDSSQAVELSNEEPYIKRQEVEKQYFSLTPEDRRLVLLYGDAGTGKSVLAHMLAARLVYDASEIISLYADYEDLFVRKVSDFIRSRRESFSGVHKSAIAAEFSQILTQQDAPRVVLIDNAAHWRAVELWLPGDLSSSLQSNVIVTSREDILPEGVGTPLWIDNMTESEAVAMVIKRLEAVSDSDASDVAKELDRRPLAIEHGCVLIRKNEMVPQEFIKMLRKDVVELLDSTPTKEPKLTAIYRRILKRISDDSNLALASRLLNLLLVVSPKVDSILVSNAWSRLSSAGNWDSTSQLLQAQTLRSAIEDLQRLALVTVEPVSSYQNLIMHNLTHSIIRALRGRAANHIAEVVLSTLAHGLDHAAWIAGNPLPYAWSNWSGSAIIALGSTETSDDLEVTTLSDMLRTGAFVLRARRQWGGTCHHCFKRYASEHARWTESNEQHIVAKRTGLAIELVSVGWLRYNGPCCPYQEPRGILRDVPVPQLHDPVVGDFWYPVQTLLEREELDGSESAVARPFVGNVAEIENDTDAARCRALNGVIHAENGHWDDAERELELAFNQLDGANLAEMLVKYDIVRRAITTHIQSGRRGALERWLQRLNTLRCQENAELYLDDKTLKALIKRIEADADLTRLYQTDPDEEGKLELCAQLADSYKRLIDDHREDRQFVLWSPASYQLGRTLAYLGEICASHRRFAVCHQYSQRAEFSRLGTMISHLAKLKLNPLHESIHNRDYRSQAERDGREALSIADQIRDVYGLPYWHSDALVTAWVLLGMAPDVGADRLVQVEREATKVLVSIGREDRLRLVPAIMAGEISSIWLFAD